MALTMTIYPSADFNSYISLVDADTILEYHIHYPLWEPLSDDDKIRYLTKAFNDINALDGFVPPDETIPDDVDCLPNAQSQTAINYLVNIDRYESRKIKSERLGPTAISYQDQSQLEGDIFPEDVVGCLKEFGALQPNTVGAVGSVFKTRF